MLWLHRGRADVEIDEWSGKVEGPAAIVAPPGVVHGFRFAPETEGLVLTLSARFLVEGELPAAAEAFRTLFLAPAVVQLAADDGSVARLDALLRALAASRDRGRRLRSAMARPRDCLACAGSRLGRARADARRHQALFTRFSAGQEHVSNAGRSSAMGALSAFRPSA